MCIGRGHLQQLHLQHSCEQRGLRCLLPRSCDAWVAALTCVLSTVLPSAAQKQHAGCIGTSSGCAYGHGSHDMRLLVSSSAAFDTEPSCMPVVCNPGALRRRAGCFECPNSVLSCCASPTVQIGKFTCRAEPIHVSHAAVAGRLTQQLHHAGLELSSRFFRSFALWSSASEGKWSLRFRHSACGRLVRVSTIAQNTAWNAQGAEHFRFTLWLEGFASPWRCARALLFHYCHVDARDTLLQVQTDDKFDYVSKVVTAVLLRRPTHHGSGTSQKSGWQSICLVQARRLHRRSLRRTRRFGWSCLLPERPLPSAKTQQEWLEGPASPACNPRAPLDIQSGPHADMMCCLRRSHPKGLEAHWLCPDHTHMSHDCRRLRGLRIPLPIVGFHLDRINLPLHLCRSKHRGILSKSPSFSQAADSCATLLRRVLCDLAMGKSAATRIRQATRPGKAQRDRLRQSEQAQQDAQGIASTAPQEEQLASQSEQGGSMGETATSSASAAEPAGLPLTVCEQRDDGRPLDEDFEEALPSPAKMRRSRSSGWTDEAEMDAPEGSASASHPSMDTGEPTSSSAAPILNNFIEPDLHDAATNAATIASSSSSPELIPATGPNRHRLTRPKRSRSSQYPPLPDDQRPEETRMEYLRRCLQEALDYAKQAQQKHTQCADVLLPISVVLFSWFVGLLVVMPLYLRSQTDKRWHCIKEASSQVLLSHSPTSCRHTHHPKHDHSRAEPGPKS